MNYNKEQRIKMRRASIFLGDTACGVVRNLINDIDELEESVNKWQKTVAEQAQLREQTILEIEELKMEVLKWKKAASDFQEIARK